MNTRKLPAMPQIVTSDLIPPDRVLLVTPGEYLNVTKPNGDVQRIEIKPPRGTMIYNVGAPREDCAFPRCQLSLGHPPTHCCSSQSRPGLYLMVDDNGNVLREI
jgi:hypothetical protein